MKLSFLTILILMLSGCASMGGSSAVMPKSVWPQFKGKKGDVVDTRYFSNARILSFEGLQILKDRNEAVDFTVRSHVTDTNDTNKTIQFEVTTIHKDGVIPLHDMAFPELREEIPYVIRTNGEVLRAGRMPPQSLFYVPSLPLPEKPVEVGDTWSMEHTWLSAKEGVPLRLDVVGILKGIVPCEKTHVCADMEITGNVVLPVAPDTIGARFISRMWGRLLFSMDRGDVIWSEMRSSEESGVKEEITKVTSCMVSEMKIAKDYKSKFSCDPTEQAVTSIPKF